MRSSFDVRLGAIAGWIALLGVIVGLIVIPTAIAGQPPTARTPLPDVIAYFRHPELALVLSVIAAFVAGLPLVPFSAALRSVLGGSTAVSRTFADLGFSLVLVSVPLYLVSGATGAMLVQASTGDPATFALLFRGYDVLYNGMADVLEGAWVGAFAIAGLRGPLPRWVAWLGLGVTATRWLKAFVPVTSMPEPIVPVSGIVFGIWFIAIVVSLSRVAFGPAPASEPLPAAAS